MISKITHRPDMKVTAMIICVSDNIWFRIGLSAIVKSSRKEKHEFCFLSLDNACCILSDMKMSSAMTIIIDYSQPEHSLLLLLLRLKRQGFFGKIIIITANEQIIKISENILLDSVADILIDNYESREKIINYFIKGNEGQFITKSITNKTWAIIKKSDCLSHREVYLMPFFMTGKRNKEISQHVNISERMVSVHRRNIYIKLHVNSLAELYNYLTTDIPPP